MSEPTSIEFATQRLEVALRRVLPGFERLRECQRLTGGANQETYRLAVDAAGAVRRLALRRAPGGVPVAGLGQVGLELETRLIRAAAQHDVPVPHVVAELTPEDGLGAGYLTDWIDGEALGQRIVRDPQLRKLQPSLAEQCGAILARIHAIDLRRAGLDGALAELSPEDEVRLTWERYRQLPAAQPMIDYTARWLLDHLPPPQPPRLVHSEFRCGNLIIDASGIRAVLDWEMAHIGDPMRDLGWLCTNSWRFGASELPVGGFGHYEELFAAYERASGRPVDPQRVRFWEVFGSFWWAIGCLEMAEMYRSGIDRSVERVVIGRRSSEAQVDCVNLIIPGAVDCLAVAAAPAAQLATEIDLVTSVRDLLRGELKDATQGRPNFLGRVAANGLDIALREAALGPALRAQVQQRFAAVLGHSDDLDALCAELVTRLRDGNLPLAQPGLAESLRFAVVNQAAIDQPGYSGLRRALATQ
jgi:aminoglycoside phosphotransferase (APT) family kinase protein